MRSTLKGRSVGLYKTKLDILIKGLQRKAEVRKIVDAPADSAIRQLLDERPQAMGLLVWPYQSADWTTSQRLDRFIAHFAVLDTLGKPFVFPPDRKLVLAEMHDIYPGLKLVLDQPRWMMREGGFTLNLFVEQLRAYSLSFSYYRRPNGQVEVMIGGLQGRDVDGILDTYRDLTKAAHGLRPRDLLMECFGILSRLTGVEHVRAVSDAKRHRRHPFFKQAKDFKQNYDDIWEERGGALGSDDFYDLPVTPVRKDLADIKAKKRPMYRRRFEFLDELESRVAENLETLEAEVFEER